MRLNSPLVPISSRAVRAAAFGAVFVVNVRAALVTVGEEIMKEDAMVEKEKVSNIVVTVFAASRRCNEREGGGDRQ